MARGNNHTLVGGKLPLTKEERGAEVYTKGHGKILATMLGWSQMSVVIAGQDLVWKKEDQEYGPALCLRQPSQKQSYSWKPGTHDEMKLSVMC